MKMEQWLTGQYLKWTRNGVVTKRRWYLCKVQMREHLFKNHLHWKSQQKSLWTEAQKETSRGKPRFKLQDLFADDRCTCAILGFLRRTEVGRTVEMRGVSKAWSEDPEGAGEEGSESGESEDSGWREERGRGLRQRE
jgi:hypothetical protein